MHIGFASVPVEDQARALAFYCDTLGFTVEVDAPYAADWRWIFLALPGAQTRLHFARKDELQWKEGMPALALRCDSVDAEAERLKAAGGDVFDGPADAPWSPGTRYLMLRDTEGNVIFMDSVAEGAADG